MLLIMALIVSHIYLSALAQFRLQLLQLQFVAVKENYDVHYTRLSKIRKPISL